MREILFRGNRLDNGDWIKGSLLKVSFLSGDCYLIFGEEFNCIGNEVKSLRHAQVDPFTVGQYTGLTDKNGKQIFEGDILSAFLDDKYPENECRTLVTWRDYGWAIQHEVGQRGCYDVLDDNDKDIWTVIGNIHDNPELMEAS